MKKLLFLLLLLASTRSFAQSNVVFKIGAAGWVTIDGQDYKRGYITYRWYLSGTDTLIELAREYNTSQPFRYGRVISKYKDGDNSSVAFASFAAWQVWWRAHGSPVYDTIVSGGGGSGTVTSVGTGFGLGGGPVTTSGNLFVDSAAIATKWYVDAHYVVSFDTTTITGSITGGGDTIRSFIATGTDWYEAYGQISATATVSSGITNLSWIDPSGLTAVNRMIFASGTSGSTFNSSFGVSYVVTRFKPAAGAVYVSYTQNAGGGNTKLSVRIRKLNN